MIVVTTPTGAIGHQVVENLLENGSQPIRVIVRDASRLAPEVRERVEVVEGSHGDAATINEALAGADTLFWLPPPNSHAESLKSSYLDFTKPACEAIQTHGVKRVVGVSAVGRGTQWEDKAGLVTASLRMDDLITATGVSFRALVMPSFMDNMLFQLEPIKNQGMFFGPIPVDLKSPTCATRDIAAVAAKWLLDSSWSGQEEVPVLGPEDLSFNDMAGIASDVLGKPVRYQQIPMDAFEAQLRQGGMSDAFVRGYVEMMSAKSEGMDNAVTRTPENSTPTTFRQWCEDNLKPAILA